MMSNINRLAAVLALAGAALAAGAADPRAEARGKKGRKARSIPMARRIVEQRVRSLVRKYRATDAQKAQLEKLAASQIRDLENLDRVNGAKGKDLQKKIDPLQSKARDVKRQNAELEKDLRKLQDEMLKLEASRKALLGKQAAELEAVITEQQRIVLRADELIRRYARGLWEEIDDGKRRLVTRAAQDAAGKIVRAEPGKQREVERDVIKELTASMEKIIGSAMTQSLRDEAIAKAAGAFRRADLTDEQKARIYDLTVRFNAEQVRRQAKLAELEEQVKALRLETSRKAPDALKQAIMEKVLTPRQRERMKPKATKDKAPKGKT